MPTNPPDHLNNIERALIDKLRLGTYTTTTGSATAWADTDVTVYGQYPTTDDINYPSIITEMVANGMEQQFMGQKLTNNAGTDARGELYGVGFNIHIMVDSDSSISITNTTSGGDIAQPYRERRLLNYLMLNCANVMMDCDFSGTTTEVVQRNYTGFQDIGYNSELEVWSAVANMIIVFKNNR